MKKIKFCPKCKTWKLLVEFQPSGRKIKSYKCRLCYKIYHQTPGRKAYSQTPEYKAKKKTYHQGHQDLWNAATAKYYCDKENQTPPWANLKIIQKFYTKAIKLTKKTGVQYDVDHIIPLHGKNVSGFHVENNLQVITGKKNSQKRNIWVS